MNGFFKNLVSAIMFLVLAAGLSACGTVIQYADSAPESTVSESASISAVQTLSPAPSASVTPSEPAVSASPSGTAEAKVHLAPYTGVVENLFFHPVIAYPQLAFDGDSKEKGLDMYMVTVSEFRKILQSLYDNGYILVNMNEVWTEITNADNTKQMAKSTLMVPEGKKPIILTFDDVNYYSYMLSNGFTHKLVLKDGDIWSFGFDPNGNPIYSQELDAITILDNFVKEHPDFSLNGAKGCLCLTGYEGILGYRTMTDAFGMTPEAEATRQKEILTVKPIISRLKETGWYFGSHSWGHINLSTAGLSAVQDDTQRWFDEVGSLVGPTQLYFYPFGARPDGDDVKQTGPIFKYLQSEGFRIFSSVGIEAYSKIKKDISAVICDRMHADGSTLRTQRNRYLKFYDAKLIFDILRPNYSVNW